eukprot:TRINITY_DN29957_c0_g1_i1.p1 TRINITY_DN29957_c0_g1~~TRINITY_DN29957_c0_g1_i1.p1  ORF type:complete len:1033 (+),score=179.41 TRINITY_DN29957_c0_g1_i1:187-3099(+)
MPECVGGAARGGHFCAVVQEPDAATAWVPRKLLPSKEELANQDGAEEVEPGADWCAVRICVTGSGKDGLKTSVPPGVACELLSQISQAVSCVRLLSPFGSEVVLVPQRRLAEAAKVLVGIGHAMWPSSRICETSPWDDASCKDSVTDLHQQLSGVWRLVRREEPPGTIVEEYTEDDGSVRVQVTCGFFVEIRVPSDSACDDGFEQQQRSFGGRCLLGAKERGHVACTHLRTVDFQPPGVELPRCQLKIGTDSIESAGSGNGYREIWSRVVSSEGRNFVALELQSEMPEPKLTRSGIWVFCGQRFARIVGPQRGIGLVAGTCCQSMAQLQRLRGTMEVQHELQNHFEAVYGVMEKPGLLHALRIAWSSENSERLFFSANDRSTGEIVVGKNSVTRILPGGSRETWRIVEWTFDPFTPKDPLAGAGGVNDDSIGDGSRSTSQTPARSERSGASSGDARLAAKVRADVAKTTPVVMALERGITVVKDAKASSSLPVLESGAEVDDETKRTKRRRKEKETDMAERSSGKAEKRSKLAQETTLDSEEKATASLHKERYARSTSPVGGGDAGDAAQAASQTKARKKKRKKEKSKKAKDYDGSDDDRVRDAKAAGARDDTSDVEQSTVLVSPSPQRVSAFVALPSPRAEVSSALELATPSPAAASAARDDEGEGPAKGGAKVARDKNKKKKHKKSKKARDRHDTDDRIQAAQNTEILSEELSARSCSGRSASVQKSAAHASSPHRQPRRNASFAGGDRGRRCNIETQRKLVVTYQSPSPARHKVDASISSPSPPRRRKKPSVKAPSVVATLSSLRRKQTPSPSSPPRWTRQWSPFREASHSRDPAGQRRGARAAPALSSGLEVRGGGRLHSRGVGKGANNSLRAGIPSRLLSFSPRSPGDGSDGGRGRSPPARVVCRRRSPVANVRSHPRSCSRSHSEPLEMESSNRSRKDRVGRGGNVGGHRSRSRSKGDRKKRRK